MRHLISGWDREVNVSCDVLLLGHEAQHLFKAVDCKGIKFALALQQLCKKRVVAHVTTDWADVSVSLFAHTFHKLKPILVSLFSVVLAGDDLAEAEDPFKSLLAKTVIKTHERLQG